MPVPASVVVPWPASILPVLYAYTVLIEVIVFREPAD
jgi:hypothetical protein